MITREVFEKAIIFASKAHEGQTRKGDGRPYILHPISVMTRILSIKKSVNSYLLGAAAILHDTVEDCGVTIEQIAKEFGYAVASLVEELTLDKVMYDKIGKKEYLAQEMVKMSSYALAIKLCDRLENVSDMEAMPTQFQKSYLDETNFILSAIEGRHLTKTHRKLISLIKTVLSPYMVKIYGRGGERRRRPLGGSGGREMFA